MSFNPTRRTFVPSKLQHVVLCSLMSPDKPLLLVKIKVCKQSCSNSPGNSPHKLLSLRLRCFNLVSLPTELGMNPSRWHHLSTSDSRCFISNSQSGSSGMARASKCTSLSSQRLSANYSERMVAKTRRCQNTKALQLAKT